MELREDAARGGSDAVLARGTVALAAGFWQSQPQQQSLELQPASGTDQVGSCPWTVLVKGYDS